MQPGFAIYLDGAPIPAPKDWDEFTTELERDDKARTISEKYRLTLTFTGGAHKHLADLYAAEGYCAESTIEIFQHCADGAPIPVMQGRILLSDCEWDLTACSVEVSVVDDGIGARIHNNRKVPVSPASDRSKNGAPIAAVVPLALRMFDCTDSSEVSGTRRGWDWLQAMGHALAYISDGTIGIVSDWYAALPSAKKIAIAKGAELRTTGYTMPRLEYTFDDLFAEVAKRYNLWMHQERTASGIVIRVEPEDYFTAFDTEAFTMTAIPALKRSIDLDRLYATVMVGSDEAIKELQLAHPLPYIPLMGFTAEGFHFTGICNTDAELDLVGKWSADTNVIQAIVVDDVEDYDDDWILVQYTDGPQTATQGNYLNPGALPSLYNEELLNINVLARYPLPSPVGANYGNNFDDSFLAQKTAFVVPEPLFQNALLSDADGTAYGPVHTMYDNDYIAPGFDPNNVWGNGTPQGQPVSLADSRFTASANAFYTFTVTLRWDITKIRPNYIPALTAWNAAGVRGLVMARAFSAGGVQIGGDQFAAPGPVHYVPGSYTDTFTVHFALQPGEYVQFYTGTMKGPNASFSALPGAGFPYDPNDPVQLGFFGAAVNYKGGAVGTSIVQDGGVLVPAKTPHIILHTFDRACPADRWLRATTTPSDFVGIDGGVLAHVKNLKRNLLTGESTWELISPP